MNHTKETREPIVTFYLDSGVILGQLEPRRRNVANKALFDEMERRKNWRIILSTMAIAEVIDTLNESTFIVREATSGHSIREVIRHQHTRTNTDAEKASSVDRLNDFMRIWRGRILRAECEADGWDFALELVKYCDISAPDAVHVAAAVRSNAHAFVTEDEPLAKRLVQVMGNDLPVVHCSDGCRVDEFLKRLRSIAKRRSHDRQPLTLDAVISQAKKRVVTAILKGIIASSPRKRS